MGERVKTELLDFFLRTGYTNSMSEENIEQARMALFDYFVDTLVDLSDPDDADRELAVDDMIQVTTILFEGLSLNVLSEDAGVLKIQVAM